MSSSQVPDLELHVMERDTGDINILVADGNHDPVPKSAIDTLTLDVRDRNTRVVINDREHQDALDANQVTMHDTSGLVTWARLPEDTPFDGSDVTGRQIREIDALFTFRWTADSLSKEKKALVRFYVSNLKDYPAEGSPA